MPAFLRSRLLGWFTFAVMMETAIDLLSNGVSTFMIAVLKVFFCARECLSTGVLLPMPGGRYIRLFCDFGCFMQDYLAFQHMFKFTRILTHIST